MDNKEKLDTQDLAPAMPPSLTVNDLNQIATIIDVSFKRGTFNATEAGPIGQIYAKLIGFLSQFEKSNDGANNSIEK